MKKSTLVLIALSMSLTSSCALLASDDFNCKTIGNCAAWATHETSIHYQLDKFEKRTLKIDKDFNVKEGNVDFIFNYLLQSNDLVRLKRENALYQIIAMKDIKEFQFPSVKVEEIPASLDFYSVEFSLGNKEKVKNTQQVVKKYLSKNGRVLEVADSPKLQVIDSGVNLLTIKMLITELNK